MTRVLFSLLSLKHIPLRFSYTYKIQTLTKTPTIQQLHFISVLESLFFKIFFRRAVAFDDPEAAVGLLRVGSVCILPAFHRCSVFGGRF
jgi:hypothetical protein